MTILHNYYNLFYVLLCFTTSFTRSVSSQQWYRATARINFQFPATESTQPMSPATERIFEDVSFEFIRNVNVNANATVKEEMQIVDADMMSQSILYDDYTKKHSLYIELRVEALYETKKTSDARDQELKRHVEDVFRGGVNDFTAQLRAESTYFDTILAGGNSSSNNNNNGSNTDNTNDDKSGTDSSSSSNSNSNSNSNNNSGNNDDSNGGNDTDNTTAEGLVVHPAFWVAGTLCAVAILSVVGFAYTYIQHRRNLFQFKAMHDNNHSDIGSNNNNNNNSNMDNDDDGVHARVADDAAASDISSLPESAYFHCTPSVDSTSMLPPTVILEREQNANAGHPPPSHFKKCYQRQAHDDDDDVESGGNNKQSVCVSDTDVSDYDFSKAGMKDTGSISTNESSFVRPSMYNKRTSTTTNTSAKPKISVYARTSETVPEDPTSYYKECSSRSRCSSPATSMAFSKYSR
mmetsp:Transcript_3726/g.5735  ORF Transcript_3726/g.5735 Transcript_3726/m.5735 type:complete len:463 (+) Transcript_3726:271-1659(+)